MSATVLLDRCLTGSPLPGRAARIASGNQWITGVQLLDRCLTGGKVGYETNFNRVFFQYQPPRPLHEIDAELAGVEQRILELLREVTE